MFGFEKFKIIKASEAREIAKLHREQSDSTAYTIRSIIDYIHSNSEKGIEKLLYPLYIEKNPVNLESILDILTEYGYKVGFMRNSDFKDLEAYKQCDTADYIVCISWEKEKE